jgi:hypothetical protein
MWPETIGQTKTNLVRLIAGDEKTMRYREANRKSGRAGKGEGERGMARVRAHREEGNNWCYEPARIRWHHSVYVPPLPTSTQEVCDRITHALQAIAADMPHRVWNEFNYHVDVCHVTQGAHIEGLLIKAWETWTVATADSVCCAHVRWEIYFLLTLKPNHSFVYSLYLWILDTVDHESNFKAL